MQTRKMTVGSALSLSLISLACSQEPHAEPHSRASHPQVNNEEGNTAANGAPLTQSGGLPATLLEGDCDSTEEGSAPALCSWAESVDAIVYGRIAALRFARTPVAGAGDEPGSVVSLTRCAQVRPALIISLDVEERLQGRRVPSTVDVWVSVEELNTWDPTPIEAQDGSVAWLKTGHDDSARLSVGQQLGVALHRGPRRTWVLSGEPLFNLDADGEVHFQPRLECEEPAPAVSGSDLQQLKDALRSCRGQGRDAAKRRRRYVERRFTATGANALRHASAWCQASPEQPPEGECSADSDCAPTERCSDGQCRSN